MVMHGASTTINADTDLMALHTQAVSKGAPQKFIVGDLPFLSYRKDLKTNVENCEKIMKAGAHSLKLEGCAGNLDLIKHMVDSGVPIMGHLGLTPQSIHTLGGFKVQAKQSKEQDLILEQSLALEKAGCFALVLECIPASIAQKISENLKIPTIGIGAGVNCDGQVLVLQDMLGMNPKFNPKFLKKYMNGFELIHSAVNQFVNDVETQSFPTEKESY
jgi:3-methyl-2-oxobutanoate hydroxymethyltransferase